MVYPSSQAREKSSTTLVLAQITLTYDSSKRQRESI